MSVRRAHQLLAAITPMVGVGLAEADVVSPLRPTAPRAPRRQSTMQVRIACPHRAAMRDSARLAKPAQPSSSAGSSASSPTGPANTGWRWPDYLSERAMRRRHLPRRASVHGAGRCHRWSTQHDRHGQPPPLRPDGWQRRIRREPGYAPRADACRRPSHPPAGCRGVAVAGAAVGGMMVASLTAIVWLHRRRRTRSTSIPKQAKRGRNHGS